MERQPAIVSINKQSNTANHYSLFYYNMQHNSSSILQDCTLYHHVFDDAVRPASKANPQSVAINLKHDVTCASKVKYEPASIARQLSNLMR